MSVQSNGLPFIVNENESLVDRKAKKQCMYFNWLLSLLFSFFCVAHMSWIMAAGLIINAGMGVSLFLKNFVIMTWQYFSVHKDV